MKKALTITVLALLVAGVVFADSYWKPGWAYGTCEIENSQVEIEPLEPWEGLLDTTAPNYGFTGYWGDDPDYPMEGSASYNSQLGLWIVEEGTWEDAVPSYGGTWQGSFDESDWDGGAWGSWEGTWGVSDPCDGTYYGDRYY